MPIRRFLILALLLAAAPFVACAPAPAQMPSRLATFERSTLEIETAGGRHRFTIELALSVEQQTQGLMFRRTMAPDAGMLFVYDVVQPAAFWMKNTFIPLDMLFVGADGRIVNIAERTVPHSTDAVPSAGPIKAVLELNGGTSQRLGIRPGDRVRHPLIAN
jgi:uncharacterized membrane protein (UPF0127 family)